MDAAERALLEETVRGALADGDATADAALAELGWLEMLDAEPRDAIEIVFDALGRTNRAATALDDVVVSALGLTPHADLAVLLPAFGTWDAPAYSGLATTRVATARDVLVVTRAASDVVAVTVPRSAVTARSAPGIDPSAGMYAVTINPGTGDESTRLTPGAWENAIALGRRAVAQQIAGATRAMLALACTHAMERVQFGRPVASFQAVRHRLAEALVAIEALEATLAAAGDEPNATTAALAKATAGRTANTVTRHCQQVLAGIGFTTDHPFHRFLKRTMVLEGLFGTADAVTVDLGRQLLASRRVPTLIEL